MTIATVADFVLSLSAFRLLEPAQQDQFPHLQTQFHDPHALAQHLQENAWLTAYQVEQLFQHGANAGLQVGPYVILDKLGEGGMGRVFKARSWKLDRLVAVKVIRRERLDKPEVVQRFRREIRAAAQLNHPNIVLAYDADEVDGSHYFAMEYVEGPSLAQYVRERGPLPVEQAVDYVRQAALGLQHAYERGLIHRDVKPQNLLISMKNESPRENGETESQFGLRAPPFGLVKILDLGLARFAYPADNSSSLQTREGAVMGTPDYIAPEQMLDAHAVDIRADLYSLGCTFYFLLTAQVPFPGGSLGEKLLKHQLQFPTPAEQLRASLPPSVAAVVRTLMAKRPEERYQTPAELATVLTTILLPVRAWHRPGRLLESSVTAPPPVAMAVPVPEDWHVFAVPPAAVPVTQDSTLVGHTSIVETMEALPVPEAVFTPPRRKRRLLLPLLLCGLIVAVALVSVLAILLSPGKPARSARRPPSRAAARPQPARFLSDLPELDSQVGYGRFGKNGDLGFKVGRDQERIVVNGVEAAHGLSLHPPDHGIAYVIYALDKKYAACQGAVALNDTAGNITQTPVLFVIRGDDRELWKSDGIQRIGSVKTFNVSIKGVDRLKLEVECAGNNGVAHAVWIDPIVK